jgi:hypothetical protein
MPRKNKVLKSAAVLTIKQGNDMTLSGRKELAAWLRKQAGFLVKYGPELAPVFRARYLYEDK